MRFVVMIPMFGLCIWASCALRTPSLSSSLSAAAPAIPSGLPAASESAGESTGGIVEAGCTFSGTQLKGEPGTALVLSCPAGCKADNNVVGTDVYANDSPVCAAAIHAGMMSSRGGEITVVVEAGRPAYRGSKRHGIISRDWGERGGSFRFAGPIVVQPEPEVVHAPIVVDAGCTFEGRQLNGEPGTVHRVSCPSGCKAEHGAWGTDTYSGHSRICVAAIHAGLSSDDGGGEFTLILTGKRPAYRGSKRNGIETGDWGEYDASFRLQR